jgi:UDP-glucuronate 4-epimerase
MNILVTGGAGFIGSRLIERLLRRTSVRATCLDEYNDYYSPAVKRANVAGFAGNERVQLVDASFCDASHMARLFDESRFTHVVHLGGYAGVRYSVENPHPYQAANVGGTLALLEAARRRPVERFLLASSSTVYGRDARAPFVEDAPLGTPLSPYGATKRAAELLGLTYCDLFRVPVVCIRPFSVYGPRLRPDLALSIFTEAILTDRPLPLFGDGSIRRDFTYVDDLCDGLEAALVRDGCVGQAINLGHDEPIAVRELISMLEAELGRPARIEQLPEKPGEMPVTHADLSKARRLLAYDPRTSFAEGLRAFTAWYRTKPAVPPENEAWRAIAR